MRITDLLQHDEMYFIGDIIEVDGSGWVDKETAELYIEEYNNGVK